MAAVRLFFRERGVLEVETPILSHAGTTDPNIASFSVLDSPHQCAQDKLKYLITSPEYHMKRLLAANIGSHFQIARVFRLGEAGSRHNPEFTLLEWYRENYDQHQLMQEVADLVNFVFSRLEKTRFASMDTLTYQQAFERYLQINPLSIATNQLRSLATRHGLMTADNCERDELLDFLMTHCVQSRFAGDKLTFIYHFPASQCALARLSPLDATVAERFELYVGDMELANGYRELCDAKEQSERLKRDNDKRRQQGKPIITIDSLFLDALVQGMPESAGVALGVDRLLMLLSGVDHINQVLAFPYSCA